MRAKAVATFRSLEKEKPKNGDNHKIPNFILLFS